MSNSSFELRWHKTIDASCPGCFDEGELLEAGNCRNHQVDALQQKSQFVQIKVINYGDLAAVEFFELRVCLSKLELVMLAPGLNGGRSSSTVRENTRRACVICDNSLRRMLAKPPVPAMTIRIALRSLVMSCHK